MLHIQKEAAVATSFACGAYENDTLIIPQKRIPRSSDELVNFQQGLPTSKVSTNWYL